MILLLTGATGVPLPVTGSDHSTHDHGPHGHSHGGIDPSIAASDRGLWAVKWSFVVLFAAAAIQLAIVLLSNSVGLLADTIHNFGDAGTAIPLAVAFMFSKKKPTSRFTYGYGRVEDFAGILVVLIILASAVVAAYESVHRLLHPQPVIHLGAVIAASIVGFLGNEGVAIFRIKVGKEIGSAALIADGYHARTDGWTSLAVLIGALGVWLGYPKADPIIGILITIAILGIVWQSAREVVGRALDGIDPKLIEELKHAASCVEGTQITEARARWLGHRLLAEVTIAVDPQTTVERGHEIAMKVQQALKAHLPFLARAAVHVHPNEMTKESHPETKHQHGSGSRTKRDHHHS
jgi:cation diffusion facilitator family transporter